MKTMRLALTIFALLAISFAPRARAAPVDPLLELAKRHFESGSAYYEAGDYLSAAREFDAAWRIRALPAFAYNIGRAYEKANKPADAVSAYERYLAAQPDAADAADVRARIAALRPKLSSPPRPTPSPSPAMLIPSPTLTPTPSVAMSTSSSRRRALIAPIAVGASALGLAIIGTGLVASAAVDYSDLSDNCPRPCPASRVDPVENRAIASYVFFGLAGAAAIADIALWVITLRAPRLR